MQMPSALDNRSPVVQRVLRIRARLNQESFLLQNSSQHTTDRAASRENAQLSWTKIDSDDDINVMHDCTALP